MPALKELVYSDLDIFFNVHPLTQNLVLKKNIEAVRQSVRNLVLTNLGERPFHPDIGADVRRSLFSNFGPMTASIIKSNVLRVIESYEPRTTEVRVYVTPNIDRNGYDLKVVFKIVNLTTPVTVDLFLERTR